MEFSAGGYPGETEAVRDLAGVTYVRSRYDRATAMEKHAHPFGVLHVVVSGATADAGGALLRNEHSVASVSFLPPATPHETRWTPGGEGFAALFSPETARSLSRFSRIPDEPIELPARAISGYLLAARHASADPDTDAAGLDSEAFLLEAITELTRATNDFPTEAGVPRWLARTRARLLDGWESPPTLTELAADAGVHPVHVARSFAAQFHESVGDCVRRRRLDRACQLMAASDDPLTVIALDCGFSDQAHFCRVFRRTFALTPSQYAESVGTWRACRRGGRADVPTAPTESTSPPNQPLRGIQASSRSPKR